MIKLPEPTESQVLGAVLGYLKRHPKVVWAERMNSGAGQMIMGGKVGQFMRFGFKGCPDIHGMLIGGRALYIECKRQSTKATAEQLAFIQRASDNGACAFIARSIDDCIAQIG